MSANAQTVAAMHNAAVGLDHMPAIKAVIASLNFAPDEALVPLPQVWLL